MFTVFELDAGEACEEASKAKIIFKSRLPSAFYCFFEKHPLRKGMVHEELGHIWGTS